MTPHSAAERVPALADVGTRPLPDRVLRQVHRIPPGGRLHCSPSAWDDALALLETGCVELRVASGAGLHLCPGAVFSLRGLTPAVLIPTERGSAAIITVRRRPEGEAS